MATWQSDPTERSIRYGNAIRVRRNDCVSEDGRRLTQASFAAHLERSPSWIKMLESGRIDPDDLPNSMHLKIRDFLSWTSKEYFIATGFALGEALECLGVGAVVDEQAHRVKSFGERGGLGVQLRFGELEVVPSSVGLL